jgi:hypothetical protein
MLVEFILCENIDQSEGEQVCAILFYITRHDYIIHYKSSILYSDGSIVHMK